MKQIDTQYGVLKDISFIEFYANGGVKECILNSSHSLQTPYGLFIPQFEDNHVRRKYTKSVSFYKNGVIKSLVLQDQSKIDTAYGSFPAESITFYENGSLKRIFPLNGKLTGYWSEEDEYTLAEDFEFNFSFGTIRKKLIGILLYPTGQIKAITLWPNETTIIMTPVGEIQIRIGLNVFENGQLKSCEPNHPTNIKTPIGNIFAYDIHAIGIHSDRNSLVFDEEGHVVSLITSTDGIEIIDSNNQITYIKPEAIPDLMDPEAMDTIPVTIAFDQNDVIINGKVFSLSKNIFRVRPFIHSFRNKCTDCSSCKGCDAV